MKTIDVTLTFRLAVPDAEAVHYLTVLQNAAANGLALEAAYSTARFVATGVSAIIGPERAMRGALVHHTNGADARAANVAVAVSDSDTETVAAWRKSMTNGFGPGHTDRILKDDAATAAEKSERAEASPVPKAAADAADALLSQVLKDAARTDGGAP